MRAWWFVVGLSLVVPLRGRADAPVDQSKSEAVRGATVTAELAPAKQEPERRNKLAGGDVLLDTVKVAGFDTAAVVVQAVIDAPPAEVWKSIEHCAEYKTFMPRIVESDELSNTGGVIRCRTKLDSPWPVDDLVGITQATVSIGDGKWVRQWHMESGDYVFIVGSWTLVPFDDEGKRTLAVYFIHSEPKGGVPGPLREMAQKTALPDVLRALRKEVARRSK